MAAVIHALEATKALDEKRSHLDNPSDALRRGTQAFGTRDSEMRTTR